MLVENPNREYLHTSLQLRGVGNRGRKLSQRGSGVDEIGVERVCVVNCEERNGVATSVDGEEVLL